MHPRSVDFPAHRFGLQSQGRGAACPRGSYDPDRPGGKGRECDPGSGWAQTEGCVLVARPGSVRKPGGPDPGRVASRSEKRNEVRTGTVSIVSVVLSLFENARSSYILSLTNPCVRFGSDGFRCRRNGSKSAGHPVLENECREQGGIRSWSASQKTCSLLSPTPSM